MALILESFQRCFSLLRKDFLIVLRATYPYLVPATVIGLFIEIYQLPMNAAALGVILGLIVFVCTYFASAILIVIGEADGKQAIVGKTYAFDRAVQAFPRAFGLFLLIGLAAVILALLLMAFLPLGLLAFAVLLVFIVYWAFILQALILRDTGVFEAFGCSFYVVRGNWWRVFGMMVALGFATWLGEALASLLPGLLGLVVLGLFSYLMLIVAMLVNTFMFLSLEK